MPRFGSPAAVDRSRLSRRRFVQTLSGAGVLGATTGVAPALMAQQPPAAASEFAVPPTLKRGAQLDSRFRVSFADSVGNGLRRVTEYFTALSERDLGALAKTLHFPFALYENIDPVVVDSAADLFKSPPPTLDASGKGRSRILPGSYDLL